MYGQNVKRGGGEMRRFFFCPREGVGMEKGGKAERCEKKGRTLQGKGGIKKKNRYDRKG